MVIASEFMGLPQDAAIKAYEVIIQFASIIAVMLIYREKITFKKVDLWMKLLVAFFPIAIVGYIFQHQIKELFNVETVAWMFIIGGIIFLLVEYFYEEKEHHVSEVEDVSMIQALYVGLAQIFSLIPGTSRAGATIIGGLLTGLDRKTSMEFSFLLAIPVMTAVSGYDLLKHYGDFVDADWTAFIVGFVTAFVVAYITIKLFLAFIQRFTFVSFGVYRIIFGVILLMIV